MKISILNSKGKHLVSITDRFNIITDDKRLKKAISKRITKTKRCLVERTINSGKKDECYVLEEVVYRKGQREYFYELYRELFGALCDSNVVFNFKEELRHSIASEGGAGSGNFGHKGIPGHKGGSKKGTGGKFSGGGGLGGYDEQSSEELDQYQLKNAGGVLTNESGFDTQVSYSKYKTTDDYFAESSFNAGDKIYSDGSEFECFESVMDYRGSRAEEFKAVRELAKKDAQEYAITESMLYDRFKKIDEMDYDAVTIDVFDFDIDRDRPCTILAKHELQREYVQTLLNERYETNCFDVKYTPWAAQDVKNRFKDGKMNIIYEGEPYLVTVRDNMVRNYCQTIAGVAMGYDHLWNTGMIDEFNLLNDRNAKIRIEEVYHYGVSGDIVKPLYVGSCWRSSGNISIFSSSNQDSVRGFAEAVFHENAHKLHGVGGSWSNSSYISAPQMFYRRNQLAKMGYVNADANSDFLKNQFDNFSRKNSSIPKSFWLPSMYGGTNAHEFFAECVANYMSPQGVLNPKNISKLSGVQKQKYQELSDWIESLIGSDKAVSSWE